MSVAYYELTQQLIGRWRGDYLLKIDPSKSILKSNSTMIVSFAVTGMVIQFDYSWEFESDREEGLLLMGYDHIKNKISMSWADSWRQNPGFMMSEGSMNSEKSISAKAEYEVSEGPNWGWRTEIILKSDNNFDFEMYNITPQGGELLAVKVEYTKASE